MKKLIRNYEDAKWTLIRGLFFLSFVIAVTIAGGMIAATTSFPYMLVGLFYLIVGGITSGLSGCILWQEYRDFLMFKERIKRDV